MAKFAIHTLLSACRTADTRRTGLLKRKKEISLPAVEYRSNRFLMLASVIGAYKPTLGLSILLESLNTPISHSSFFLKESLTDLLSTVNTLKQNAGEGHFFVWTSVCTRRIFGEAYQYREPMLSSILPFKLRIETSDPRTNREETLRRIEKEDEDWDRRYMMPKYMSLDVLLAVGKRSMLKLSGQMAEANALRNDLNRLGASLTEQVFMDAAFNAYVEAFNKCLIWGVFNPDDALASIDYYERNIVGDPKTAYLLVKNPEDGANGLIDVLVADYEESEGQIKSPPDRLLSDPWLAEALQR